MDSRPAAPKLGGGPPLFLVMLLLAAGGAGRAQAIAKAEAADRAAIVAAESKTAAARREQDSLALVLRVAEAPLSSPVLLELDSAIHAAGIPVSHDDVHNRATVRKIDSAVRLVRRGRAVPALLAAAQSMIDGTSSTRAVDIRRVALLRAELADARRQFAADSARKATAAARRLRAGQGSSAPGGATARCRDGSYSFSGSRRGTCSHHGGVAVWLR